MEVALKLEEWMKAQVPRKTQEEVALLLGLSQPTVSRIINGIYTQEHADAVMEMTAGEVDLSEAA